MGAAEIIITVLGLAAGILATAGYGAVSVAPADFKKARVCFYAAAICAGAAVILWGVTTVSPTWARILAAGILGALILVGLTEGLRWLSAREHSGPAVIAEGGQAGDSPRGGDVDVAGDRSGGIGGDAGTAGRGGDVRVRGEGAYGRGGAGANRGTADGRGGRAAKGPIELENGPTAMWRYGRGGIGGNEPEYNRRLMILTRIRAEYLQEFPDEKIFVDAGVDPVPANWVNKRLEELGESWRVTMGSGGYVVPPLNRLTHRQD